MAAAVVTPVHSFGLSGSVRDNVCYLDEQTIVYPSGAALVVYNTETKEQHCIASADGITKITAMAVSPNRRYAAVADKAPERPASVSIYDLHTLKRRKTLMHNENVDEFVSMAFSPDSKYLATLGNAPDWPLYYWAWEKSRGPMATAKVSPSPETPVYEVTFNPQDNTHLCVSGQGIFKLFRYQEGNLRMLSSPKQDPPNCLCHAWVAHNRVLVGTDQNKVIMYENGEYRTEYTISKREKSEDLRIECISTLAEGFVCGSAMGGVYKFSKVEDSKDQYSKDTEHSTPNDTNGAQVIETIAVNPSETKVVVTTDVNQLYTKELNPDVPEDNNKPGQSQGPDPAELSLVLQPFHHGAINGLSLAVRKPLIATCSSDCSVRIWNYADNSSELQKYFSEAALSVSIHPAGLFVLVGFTDQLRLLNLLIDDIQEYQEFPIKNCQECCFSNGGHLFAATNGQNIEIYSTYSFQNLGTLKGHNQKVTSIVWDPTDSKITTCGQDGAVYVWDTHTFERLSENVIKSCSYSSVCPDPNGKSIFAVGSDRTLKELNGPSVIKEIASNSKVYPIETVLKQVVLSKSGASTFVATERGAVRSLKSPLNTPWEGSSLTMHNGAVSKLVLSSDNKYLFSSGLDGSVFVYLVRESGRGKESSIAPIEYPFAEEVLITKRELEEKNRALSEKNTEVQELKMSNEYQMRLKEMNFQDQMKKMQRKFEEEIESLKIKLTHSQNEKSRDEQRSVSEVAELHNAHSMELQEVENMNNQKLLEQYEKYERLQRKAREMQERAEIQLDEVEKEKSRALEELVEFWEAKVLEKNGQLEALREEKEEEAKEYQEIIRQMELDTDKEILSIKNTYERELKEERETVLRLQGDNGVLQKKFRSMVTEIQDQKKVRDAMEVEQRKLQAHIRALDKEILSGKKDCEERDETIQDKEKRIYDLKKKNQELEKFKFVLDYKIKELKKQIEPRENEIKEMKIQIKRMDEELATYYKENTDLKLQMERLKLQVEASDRERRKSEQRAVLLQNRLIRFQADLQKASSLTTEPQKLSTCVKEMYRRHAADSAAITTTIDEDIQQEHNRQRQYLERSVADLRGKLDRTAQLAAGDTTRVMHENVLLIREINELRKELSASQERSRHLEASLTHTQKLAKMRGDTHVLQASMSFENSGTNDQDLERIIELQKTEIRKLRSSLDGERTRTPQRLEPISSA